jgi:hypothetical protein
VAHVGEDLVVAETKGAGQALQDQLVCLVARVFPVECESSDLFLKLRWEESLELVGKLLSLVEVNLTEVETIFVGESAKVNFEFGVTREQAERLMMLILVTHQALVHARILHLILQCVDVSFLHGSDCLFIVLELEAFLDCFHNNESHVGLRLLEQLFRLEHRLARLGPQRVLNLLGKPFYFLQQFR